MRLINEVLFPEGLVVTEADAVSGGEVSACRFSALSSATQPRCLVLGGGAFWAWQPHPNGTPPDGAQPRLGRIWRSLFTRSSIGGWVEKRPAMPLLEKGLTM